MSTPNKTSPRVFEKPVAWLLGAQLIGGLKGMLLYTAYGSKLDPRDWMTADPIPFNEESKTEFWFDYLSDAGDGTKAMYSIAYLTLSSLWTKLTPGTKALPSTDAEREVSTVNDGKFSFVLPRGEFLFFGGDTSYHAAEYMTLVNRIQHPFNYAYEDLRARGLISDSDARRPIFGIPGNHDYYDQIDGFRRQFRKPTRDEGPLPPKHAGGANAQLTVAGFKRVQEASYLALQLPFGWQLWGLDTESPSDRSEQNLDRRQETFFKTTSTDSDGNYKPPDKLILATCSPSTVFGHLADEKDRKVARPQEALKLSRPFLPDKPAGQTDLTETGDMKLESGQCRLDLSGDVHHYARYWGPQVPSPTPPRKHNSAPRPSAQSYASIVSGAGGAFHHSSSTYDNEICEQVLYPPEDRSREAAGNRIFKFWNIFSGGRVWLFGLIIAVTIYFAASVTPSSSQFLGSIGLLNTLNLSEPQDVQPTVVLPNNPQACAPVTPFWLWSSLGVATDRWQPPAKCSAENPGYIHLTDSWPRDLLFGVVSLILALSAVLVTLYFSIFTKKIFDDENAFKKIVDPAKKLWPIIAVTVLFLIIGLFSIKPYRDHIAPFHISALILLSILVAVCAIAVSFRYGDYRFKKSFVPGEKTDPFLEVAGWLVGLGVFGFCLWSYGRLNPPAYLISDILFMLVLIAALLAIIALPFFAAGALFYTKPRPVQIVGRLLIGIWHVILQLLVPFILITQGDYITWILAAVLLVLPIPLAQFLVKKNQGVLLSVLWVVYGAVMLTLPWIVHLFKGPFTPVFANVVGWWVIVPLIAAAAGGAIFSCLWTGWYFAVCFLYNGHNNEVGGAARIEEFKQFIRFRLTPEGLTGYVIAVDDVSKIGEVDSTGHTVDGSDLQAKLIDVFHIVPKA